MLLWSSAAGKNIALVALLSLSLSLSLSLCYALNNDFVSPAGLMRRRGSTTCVPDDDVSALIVIFFIKVLCQMYIRLLKGILLAKFICPAKGITMHDSP